MSCRNWQLRLQDILQSITSIQQRVAGREFEEFQADETVIKAVLYDLIIIGEAALNIPDEVKSRYSSIPWRLMSDARNVMTHEYFRVNLDVVWDIITNNLPPLVPQLQNVLQKEENEK